MSGRLVRNGISLVCVVPYIQIPRGEEPIS
jgi:hypothetical protein